MTTDEQQTGKVLGDVIIALIHSPLVGPLTWAPVAEELQQRGIRAVVPTLDDVDGGGPYWKQQAESAARGLDSLPLAGPLVLVGHSGAGPLLPGIGASTSRPVAAYVFVDAGLPHGGKSRLEEMEENVPELAAWLRSHLDAGGRFPEWTDEDLREIIPDDRLRHGVVAELRPRPRAFFEERFPLSGDWPHTPCGYVRLSAAYAAPAEQARSRGWEWRELDAGHFHLLVDPAEVTDVLVDLITSMERSAS